MVVSVLSTDSGLFGSLAGRVSGWFSGSGDQIEHEPLGQLDEVVARTERTQVVEVVALGDGGPDHLETARILVRAGADISIGDRAGVTPLQHAEIRGYDAMARLIATEGP